MNTHTELITKLTAVDVRMAQERQEIVAQIKQLESERDSIDEKLRWKLEHSGAHIGTFRSQIVIEMRPWTRRTLDTKRLRLEQPQIAEKYTRESSGLSVHYPS